MPMIYVTDETKKILDTLVNSETRTISTEVDFLCCERLKQLGIPADAKSSVVCNTKPIQNNNESQGKN
jgi:hypothetical protein